MPGRKRELCAPVWGRPGRGTVGKTAVIGVKERRANRVNAAVVEATDAPTAHTNEVESFWALLKRGYIRIYHHFSRKHLRRYSSEFEGRPNQRPQDTLRQRVLMATGLAGQRLRYARPDCLTGKGGSRPATGRAVYPA